MKVRLKNPFLKPRYRNKTLIFTLRYKVKINALFLNMCLRKEYFIDQTFILTFILRVKNILAFILYIYVEHFSSK